MQIPATRSCLAPAFCRPPSPKHPSNWPRCQTCGAARLPGVNCEKVSGPSYLELLEVVAVPGPVDLREEVVVEDLAEQLEEVDLHLVEALVLQQLVQLRLPLLVVQRGEELPDQRRHLPVVGIAPTAAIAAGGAAELEVLQG